MFKFIKPIVQLLFLLPVVVWVHELGHLVVLRWVERKLGYRKYKAKVVLTFAEKFRVVGCVESDFYTRLALDADAVCSNGTHADCLTCKSKTAYCRGIVSSAKAGFRAAVIACILCGILAMFLVTFALVLNSHICLWVGAYLFGVLFCWVHRVYTGWKYPFDVQTADSVIAKNPAQFIRNLV